MKNLVADAPRLGKADSPASQRRHLHCVRPWLTSRQASALFSRRTIGKPNFGLTRQLCTRSTPLPRSANSGGALSRRSVGRKLARQSKASCAPPEKGSQTAARLRPANQQ